VSTAAQVTSRLPNSSWQRYSAGAGAKGQRYYDWALVDLTVTDAPGYHWLLVRRNNRTGELAFYRAHSPRPVPLTTLVRVAGRRWSIEESFQSGKELAGLDEHQVRGWTSWHRWTVLAMLAHAFLSVMTAAEHTDAPASAGLIPLSRNEIRHLFIQLLTQRALDSVHIMRWSRWRRRHQAVARASHYRRQAAEHQ